MLNKKVRINRSELAVPGNRLEFFDKAVTDLLPPPLVQMMGAFGEEVKEEALKLMEEN